MARPGDVIDNPLTGERMVFRATGRETRGELLEFDVHLRPGAPAPAPHLHARQEESVEILEGTVRARIADHDRSFGPGERIVMKPGVGHAWWVEGTAPALARVRHRPALESDAFFEDLFALARSGKADARGNPGLLRMLVLARRHDVWAAKIPLPLQRALAALTAPIARLLGLDARPSEADPRRPAATGPRAPA